MLWGARLRSFSPSVSPSLSPNEATGAVPSENDHGCGGSTFNTLFAACPFIKPWFVSDRGSAYYVVIHEPYPFQAYTSKLCSSDGSYICRHE